MPNYKSNRRPTQRGKQKKKAEKPEKLPAVPQTPSGPDLINELNDDCLARIFKCLTMPERLGIELVCKRWKDVSQLAWDDVKQLDLLCELPLTAELEKAGLSKDPTQYATGVIKKSGRYLDKLTIGSPCSNKILPLVGQCCYNLTKLELHFDNYDKNTAKVFSQLQKLKYFKMDGIRQHFPGDILLAMPAESLTEVHLFAQMSWDLEFDEDDCTIFLPRVAPTVFANLTKLKAITLDSFVLKPNLMNILTEKKDLTFLALSNCRIQRNLSLLSNLKKLEHLNLCKADVDDSFLDKISNNCENLKFLDITDCLSVSDIGIRHLQKLSKLEELLVSDSMKITDEPLSRLHSLKKLECDGCSEVTDNGIITLIKYATNLEYLNVANTRVTERLLVEATEITKKRTNGVTLRLIINNYVKDEWDQDEDFSPLLEVEGLDDADLFSGSDPDYYDYDDDYYDEDDDEDYDDYDAFDPYGEDFDDYDCFDGFRGFLQKF